MTHLRQLEWAEIRRLYVQTFKECLKLAKQSHEGLSAPEARALNQHPVYGFGVAVEITWQGRNEQGQLGELFHKLLELHSEAIEGGE